MPSAKKFAPSLHPRDRHGRFTRSRSLEATVADRKTAGEVAAGLKPKKGVGGTKAGGYLRTVGGGEHDDTVHAYTTGGYVDTHKALRAGITDEPSVKAMDAAMVGLPDDLVLSRRVPNAAFGPDGPQSLVGLKVRDAAYSPTAVGTVRATKGDVRVRYAVPAGTRAAVDPQTGEVVLDRDLEAVVAKVEPNSVGGFDMYVTVLPKAGVKNLDGSANSAKTSAKPKHAAPDVASKPEGEARVRADLMKLKVADLQAQMRERGLKPGRKRKSELVDALVADEMGHTGHATAKPNASPATDGDALDAAPAALDRTGSTPLTQAQRDALDDYQSSYYYAINGQLRRDEVNERVRQRVDAIDSVMAVSPLTRDVQVWRGITNSSKLFGDRLSGDLTGMRWREDAYVSTSAKEREAKNFTYDGTGEHPVVMRITAPEGTPAVQVSGMNDQAELLIGRGHDFRIIKDHGVVDGVRRVDVDVQPNVAEKPGAVAEPKPATGQQAFEATPISKAAGWPGLPAASIEAISRYQSGAHSVINRVLRGQQLSPYQQRFYTHGQIREWASGIDDAMAKSKLRTDISTQRTIFKPETVFGDRVGEDMTGLVWREDAFVSTTTSEDVTKQAIAMSPDAGEPLVMNIVAPAGTGAVAFDEFEAEVLLDRGHQFKVTQDRGVVGGVRTLDVQVLPKGATDAGQ